MWRSHDKTLVFVQRRIATCKRFAYRVMSTALVLRERPAGNWAVYVAGVAELRRVVLLSVASEHSKRNYAKALDEIFALCEMRQQPLSRALLMEYRAAMVEKKLSASTVNVRLSAIRKLVSEAQRNGILDAEQAAKMTDVPNMRQQGTRLGNWLTRDQAKELLAVPDRSTIKGKRDYCILALLVGCALRRKELSTLTLEDIQLREGRWVIVDLVGKGGRVRTVAIPVWVKNAINSWQTAAKIEDGRLLRPLSKSGRILGEELGDWAIWSVVEISAKEIGIEHFGAHDLRRTCAKLCRKNGGDLEQIKFLLGHSSIQTTERYLGSEQDIVIAVNDNLGL
jgi:integrase